MDIHRSIKTDSGAALVEAVFTLPILLVFTFAMVDLGNWFLQHYTLSRVVYEGARVGAGLPDLIEPVGNNNAFTVRDGMNCIAEPLNSTMAESLSFNEDGLWVMQSRMGNLAQIQFDVVNPARIDQGTVWSCFDADDRVIQTEVSLPFGSLVGRLFNVNGWMYRTNQWPQINVRARAPYLSSS